MEKNTLKYRQQEVKSKLSRRGAVKQAFVRNMCVWRMSRHIKLKITMDLDI